MDRENYYLLLELDVDPPEEDPKRIEKAIKQMQTAWSRLRNHPTKGLQAKNYIGLIPDIRKVMSDPELRMAEAARAVELVRKQKGDMYAEIDRHLVLHLSKGYVTNQEIAKLAELHHVDEEQIRERITKMEEGRQAELESQLGLLVAKGYITEEEISKLSKAHGASVKDLKKRINVPVRKAGDQDVAKAKGLDKSIEKVIADNLKIVGYATLYEFLGVPESSSLELLTKRAKEKELEIRKISRKDAVVTASSILAGQCSAIFKSGETRAAYDITRGRSRLKDLDADIDVAGIDGTIRSQYFNILVGTAMNLGMDAQDAKAYIKKYCRQKKYVIEGQERKKLSKTQLIIAGAVLALAVIGAITGFFVFQGMQAKSAFEAALQKAQASPVLEQRASVWKEYLAAGPSGKYAEQAGQFIQETKDLMAKRDEKKSFDQTAAQVQAFLQANDFKQALAAWDSHLKAHPKGDMAAQAKKAREQIEGDFDKYQFDALQEYDTADADVRIAIYMDYIANHPEGRYRDQVTRLVWDMGEEYYLFLQKKITAAAEREDWGEAVAQCDAYIRVFDNARAKQLQREKEMYKTRAHDQKVFEDLEARAARLGADYDGAAGIFRDHLMAYPETTVKDKITARINQLMTLKAQAARDAALNAVRAKLRGSGRFAEKSPGVVQDKTTGLSWAMLDSQDAEGACMTYESAKNYVAKLNVNGVKGWRLPTAKELNALYKTPQGYPQDPAKVYWTSKSFPSYADGVMFDKVDVVPADPELDVYPLDSRNCAAVHPVKK